MRVFEEKQKFNQWWFYMILILVLLVILNGIYQTTEGFKNFENPYLILLFLAAISPIIFIQILRLHTRIDPEGIKVEFYPLKFTRKFFPWKEIDKVYIRKYSPVLEYGGWGIRVLRKKRAYNTSGNLGIQIVTTDKKEFLIGTLLPDAARAVLQRYQHKTSKNNRFN